VPPSIAFSRTAICSAALDAGQLADEAAAGGDQDLVGRDRAGVGLDHLLGGLHAGDRGLDVLHLVTREEGRKRQAQRLGGAQPGRDPDRGGQVMQLLARRDDGDLGLDVLAAQFANGGQGGKARAENGNSGHVLDPG